MDSVVLEWVREAPFSNLEKMRLHPNFSYEEWFARGRALPHAVDTLVALLEREDLQRPSGDGMRAAYALGWIDKKGDQRAIDALVRSLQSKDVTLRVEAVAALGRLGNPSVLPLLEDLAANRKEDVNIRGNAYIALGRLGVRSSEKVLREGLNDTDSFVAGCAEEGLKLLGAAPASSPQ